MFRCGHRIDSVPIAVVIANHNISLPNNLVTGASMLFNLCIICPLSLAPHHFLPILLCELVVLFFFSFINVTQILHYIGFSVAHYTQNHRVHFHLSIYAHTHRSALTHTQIQNHSMDALALAHALFCSSSMQTQFFCCYLILGYPQPSSILHSLVCIFSSSFFVAAFALLIYFVFLLIILTFTWIRFVRKCIKQNAKNSSVLLLLLLFVWFFLLLLGFSFSSSFHIQSMGNTIKVYTNK